nr:DUF3466 family protein [Vibrio campbellii]
MGGINSYNEIVGQLDAEKIREEEGKPRRKRGFIYPYTKTGEAVSQRATDLFEGKPWFLDNLTNGGEYSEKTTHSVSSMLQTSMMLALSRQPR